MNNFEKKLVLHVVLKKLFLFKIKRLNVNINAVMKQNSRKKNLKGIGGKSLFSQLDFILKSCIQATRCFLQISKIQSNF